MLLLSRRKDEGFKICTPSNELIEISIKNFVSYPNEYKDYSKISYATVGINAPKDYVIVRDEIYVQGQEKLIKEKKLDTD